MILHLTMMKKAMTSTTKRFDSSLLIVDLRLFKKKRSYPIVSNYRFSLNVTRNTFKNKLINLIVVKENIIFALLVWNLFKLSLARSLKQTMEMIIS